MPPMPKRPRPAGRLSERVKKESRVPWLYLFARVPWLLCSHAWSERSYDNAWLQKDAGCRGCICLQPRMIGKVLR